MMLPVIALEGLDFSGKSSVLPIVQGRLADFFGTEFVRVKYPSHPRLRPLILGSEREPAAAFADEFVRQQIFAADMTHTTIGTVIPALEAGSGVLADRYLWSNFVYAHYGFGLDAGRVREYLNQVIPPPYRGILCMLNVLLDIPVSVMRERQTGVRDLGDSYDDAFYERVRQGYLACAQAEPENWLVIDATPDLDTVQHVTFNAIKNAIINQYGRMGKGMVSLGTLTFGSHNA